MEGRCFAAQSRSNYKYLYFFKFSKRPKIIFLHFTSSKLTILVNLSSHILPPVSIRIQRVFVAPNYGKFTARSGYNLVLTYLVTCIRVNGAVFQNENR